MMRNKAPRCGWAAAKDHSFVTLSKREAHVVHIQKLRQDDALPVQMKAHIAACGQYRELPNGPAA